MIIRPFKITDTINQLGHDCSDEDATTFVIFNSDSADDVVLSAVKNKDGIDVEFSTRAEAEDYISEEKKNVRINTI